MYLDNQFFDNTKFIVRNIETGQEVSFQISDTSDPDFYKAAAFSADSQFAYFYKYDGSDNLDTNIRLFRVDLRDLSYTELFVFRASSVETEVAPDNLSFVTSANRLLDESIEQVGPFAVNTASGAVFDLNQSASGQEGNGTVSETHVVNGGKFAAFVSTSSNLVAGDTNGAADVFLRNLETGEVTLVSRSAAGVLGNGASGGLDVSADGTKLLFRSTASNLVSGDTNGFQDVFVKDLATGQVTLVSTSATGQQGNGDSRDGTFSPDGRSVAFLSNAANLAPNDINGTVDAFLKNLGTGAVTPLSYVTEDGRITGFPANGTPIFRPDGSISFGDYSYTFDTDGVLVLDVTNNLPSTQLDAISVSKGDGTDPVRYGFQSPSTTGDRETSQARLDYDRDGDFQATVTGLKGTTTVSTETYTVKVRAHAGSQNFTGDGGSEIVVLSSRDDRADGGGGDDVLLGYAGRDDLSGGAGNDRLDGGRGDDTLRGGTGDDRYVVDAVGDVVVEAADAGRDTIETSLSLTLAANVEDLVLTGTAGLSGTGNGLGNTITGNRGNNTLLGLDGDDVLNGGAGNDRLEGGSGNDTLDGGTGDDTLIGGIGNDTLQGGAGTDRLIGGSGDDTYVVDSISDVVEEQADGGIDTIVAGYSATLGANIENLTLSGDGLSYPGRSFSGTGNASDNVITGNDRDNTLNGLDGDDVLIGNGGNDTLYGGAGADRMEGGTGSDSYFVTDAGDQVIETDDVGVDIIYTTIDWTLTNESKVERLIIAPGTRTALTLVGNDLRNTITTGSQNDVLDGGAGADTLTGKSGSDTYYVDDAGDVIVEAAGDAGSDTLIASTNYVLGNNVSIETMRFAEGRATTSLDLIGNAFGQTLIGNGGASRLIGGGGDDTYIVDDRADQVFEAVGGGNDTIVTSGSYILAAGQEIETLKLSFPTGTATRGLQGNEFANTLIGNDGVNNLDGGGGDDVLIAGAGNDTLTGGAGKDTLNGGTEADRLIGGAGDDTYLVDTVDDRVVEAVGGGNDRVFLTGTFYLSGGQEVETLQLLASTGTAAHNVAGNEFGQTLVGNAGANALDGKGGLDVLTGGRGADTFVFSTALGSGNVDRITDFAAEDRFLLKQNVFTALASGQLAESAFKNLDAGAADADDRILYQQSTGEVFYDADGSGTGAAVKFAVLDNKAALTAADFVV